MSTPVTWEPPCHFSGIPPRLLLRMLGVRWRVLRKGLMPVMPRWSPCHGPSLSMPLKLPRPLCPQQPHTWMEGGGHRLSALAGSQPDMLECEMVGPGPTCSVPYKEFVTQMCPHPSSSLESTVPSCPPVSWDLQKGFEFLTHTHSLN